MNSAVSSELVLCEGLPQGLVLAPTIYTLHKQKTDGLGPKKLWGLDAIFMAISQPLDIDEYFVSSHQNGGS